VITGENITSIDYSQPLLQNRNGLNNKLSADIATIEIAAQSVSRIEQTEVFISNKIKRLIDLALAQEKEKIYRQQLKLTLVQFELAENKLKHALIDQSDFLSEMDAKFRAEQQWLQSQSELTLLKQELAALANIQESEMVIEFDLYQQHDIVQVDSESILPNLRVMQQIQIERQKLLRQKQSLEDKLLPSINLSFGLSTQGEGNNYFDGFSNQDQFWRMGVDVSYPLGQNKAMLNLVQSDISLARLNARQREVEINTKQQIGTLVLQVKFLRKTMEISQDQVQIAKDKVYEEDLKFENARGNKSLLISTQKALNLMKLAHAQTAANYQINVIEYRSTIDQLL
jgi:outer membrane protein TolC